MRTPADWENEVRALLAASSTLSAAAHAAVKGVLDSLAEDPSLDGATRRDVHRLRSALAAPADAAEAA